jgi:hypothetical protein
MYAIVAGLLIVLPFLLISAFYGNFKVCDLQMTLNSLVYLVGISHKCYEPILEVYSSWFMISDSVICSFIIISMLYTIFHRIVEYWKEGSDEEDDDKYLWKIILPNIHSFLFPPYVILKTIFFVSIAPSFFWGYPQNLDRLLYITLTVSYFTAFYKIFRFCRRLHSLKQWRNKLKAARPLENSQKHHHHHIHQNNIYGAHHNYSQSRQIPCGQPKLAKIMSYSTSAGGSSGHTSLYSQSMENRCKDYYNNSY